MNREQLKKEIIDFIRKNNHVSYVELQGLFDELGYDYKGDLDIVSAECGHILFWSGWNEDAIKLMNEVQSTPKIHREPTDLLTYLIDGASMDLPIAKRAVNYKTDHWLPVVFCKSPERSRA